MKKIVAFLLLAAMLFSLAACSASSGAPKSDEPAQNTSPSTVVETNSKAEAVDKEAVTSAKSTLTIAVNADHGNVSMAHSVGNNASMLSSLCSNKLVDYYYDENGGTPVGICDRGLATEYTFDDDEMGVTFKLREGVLFQSGVEMTAEDVVFSLKFFQLKDRYNWIDYDNLKAIDTYTVYIPFTEKSHSAITMLSVVSIWNEDYWNEIGGDETVFFHDAPIGTGAWKITKYETDDYVSLEAFDDYFEGRPILDSITVRFIAEGTVAFSELETGGVDYVFTPDGGDVNNVLNGDYGEQLKVYSAMKEDALLLGFNGYTESLQDIRVRKAFCYALNRADMVTVFDGTAVDMYTVTSNSCGTMTNYSDNWFYNYEPETAKTLLAEAGWSDTDGDGFVENAAGEKLTLRYLYIGSNAIYATIGEIMKNNLADVGIGLELCGYDVTTYDDMMRNDVGAWDVYEMQLGSIGSENGWGNTYESAMLTYNHADQFDTWNDYYDNYIHPLNVTMNQGEWETLFKELEPRTMTDYLYWYPLCQRLDTSVYASNLVNFERIGWKTWNLANAYFAE